MIYLAKIEQGVVSKITFGEAPIQVSDPDWVEFSPNAWGGKYLDDTEGTPMRYNTPGFGYTYDQDRDAFIPPRPFASWVLNEVTCLWEAPVPMPLAGAYLWDEPTSTWVAV